MKKLILLLVAISSGVWAGEAPAVLKQLTAPAEEFLNMPARYVFEKLEKAARSSGDPELGGFRINFQLAGAADKRVDINMEGMDLLQALETVAAATGGALDYHDGIAVLMDPTQVVRAPEPVAEAKDVENDDGKEVTFSDIHRALVFVDSGVGSGSAFRAEMNGKTYIFSNQHNFMGATKLELRKMQGGLVDYGSFEFNKDRDLVRFELKSAVAGDDSVLKLSDKTPAIGQSISVYGNSAGGNVATELKGEILGVGPRVIEVDAPIVSGNSGSPILDTNGRVLGVATYVTFELEFDKNDKRKQMYKGTRFDDTRRFGVRIPKDGWVKIELGSFLNQTYRLADTKNYVEILHILIEHWSGNEDYADAARRIMSSYSSRGGRVKPPYEFHNMDTESEVSMMVKAFSRNYQEFKDMVRKMELTKKELAKLDEVSSISATSKLERADYHLRSSLLSKTKRKQDELDQYEWMSSYMRKEAKPLTDMTGELIRMLEGNKKLSVRVKAVMK